MADVLRTSLERLDRRYKYNTLIPQIVNATTIQGMAMPTILSCCDVDSYIDSLGTERRKKDTSLGLIKQRVHVFEVHIPIQGTWTTKV